MAEAKITGVTLELTYVEADALCDLLGSMSGADYTKAGLNGDRVLLVSRVFHALSDALSPDED